MVNLNNHSSKQLLLNYLRRDETVPGNKSTQETNDFSYALGDLLRFTGFAKNPSEINGSDVIEAAPTANENYLFEIIEGIPCPGIPFVTYEGQTYNTVQIAVQCWFKENLNVGTMVPGNQNQSNNGIIEKYCFNNSPANCDTYGGLYQWDEIMQYTVQQGTQGICPNGWHIPTNSEWTELIDFLGYEAVAGGKMKSTGTIEAGTGLWTTPNEGATNSSGFTALPGGFRNLDGVFGILGYWTYICSSTEYNFYSAFDLNLFYFNTAVNRPTDYKDLGFSVRCVKNE
jgi:uncharacterized protein (TIGR02145 family)